MARQEVVNAINEGENRYRQTVLGQSPLPGYPIVRREPWSYLANKAAADAPQSDNPSGLFCRACRSVGLRHCSDPEHCGGMEPMAKAPVERQQEKDNG